MKIRPSIQLFAGMCAAIILAAGCSSTSDHGNAGSTQTQVSLTHANYKMVKAGAVGHSYGFRFLLGIIPITSPSTAAARADLYRSLNEPVGGKSIALVNVTEDHSTTWLLLFSIPKTVITGDVVEFLSEGKSTVQPVQLAPAQ